MTDNPRKVEVTEDELIKLIDQVLHDNPVYRLSNELINQLMEKNAQYKDSWQNYEILTPLIRIKEKLVRMETLSDGRTAIVTAQNYPAIREELKDIVGYGLLALLWLDEYVKEE